jgi:hypothetical protein
VTRALFHYVLDQDFSRKTAWDPACGKKYMAQVLHEYFKSVRSSDIGRYGSHIREDFLTSRYRKSDWIITNPPFLLAEDFISKAIELAREGSAILVRTTFLQGIGRWDRVLNKNPPAVIAQFVERPRFTNGQIKKSTASGGMVPYCWIVWRGKTRKTSFVWIPPCVKDLEKDEDYIMRKRFLPQKIKKDEP